MATSEPDALADLSPTELLDLVRELRQANEQLRSLAPTPPSAAQSLLDEQLRRTSLLTQLAIEFREALDPAMIVEQTLRAMAVNLVLTGANIVLIGPGTVVDLALAVQDGVVRPMPPELAGAVLEKGLAGWVLRHGSSVALSDVARDRRWLEFSEPHSAGSVIVIPIRQSAATLGVLTVHRPSPHAFNSHDLILLEGVAAQLGVALSAARHQAGERHRRNQAMALLAMSQFLTAERSPGELAAMLYEKSVGVFGAQAGFLFLGDSGGELRPVLPEGVSYEPALAAAAAGAARLAWAGQATATTGPTPESTCVAMPLLSHGVTIGAYALIHANGSGFSAAVWSLLTVFTQVIAAACANISLVARLTEQAHALEQLVEQRTDQVRRSRDALRTVFDSLHEGILLLDGEERVLAANCHFCEGIAGLHPREVVARSYAHLWQRLERRGRLSVTLLATPGIGRQRLAVRQLTGDGERSFLVERKPIGGEHSTLDQYLEFWHEQA